MAQFEKSCRSGGLKVTHQRMEIFRELIISTNHPTAEMLHQRLVKNIPSLSLDTVYRTLATFEKLWLIHRIETIESHARFEVTADRHHHFICDTCGGVTDFYWQTFDTMHLPDALENVGQVHRQNVVIQGTCAGCLQKNDSNGN